MDIDKICYEFDDECYINIRDSLANHLKEKIDNLMCLYDKKKIAILCIGTDKIKDDSYGPIIGSSLFQSELYTDISIFGTMQNTLNGTNIEQFLCQNASIINESLVIAIDASVSKYDNMGSIIISNDGLYPGAGVGKSFPKIGDFSIRGVTSNDLSVYDIKNIEEFNIEKFNMEEFIEGSISIEKLKKMCEITVDALYMALGIKANYDEIISECIKQLENQRIELEKIFVIENYSVNKREYMMRRVRLLFDTIKSMSNLKGSNIDGYKALITEKNKNLIPKYENTKKLK